MIDSRADFRDFLLRLADNNLLANDWNEFAIEHYSDDELEHLRQELVKISLDYPDWQIGWIPPRFQDAARNLAEQLAETSNDSITYWTEWFNVADDGTIQIKITWAVGTSLSTGMSQIHRDSSEYSFWFWLIGDPNRRKGLKGHHDIQAMKLEFERTRRSLGV